MIAVLLKLGLRVLLARVAGRVNGSQCIQLYSACTDESERYIYTVYTDRCTLHALWSDDIIIKMARTNVVSILTIIIMMLL